MLQLDKWTRFNSKSSSLPQTHSTRMLVSDGTHIFIGFYTLVGPDIVWFFDNRDKIDKEFEVKWLHELPDLPPKILTSE